MICLQDEQPSGAGPLPADLMESLLSSVERVPIDSKWVACKEELGQAGDRIAILTDFADTADYLGELGREEGFQLTVLTGRTPPASRVRAAKGEGRPRLRIATTAALEGIQLPELSKVIHYDPPWQPIRLYERFLAVTQPGKPSPEHVFLVDEESGANWSLPKMLDWVAQVERELAG